MSVKIMGLVWDLQIESNKKFVLLAYADHANHDGGNIWPSVETVAKKTGYHERSVQRISRELETLGYLIPDGSGPGGTNKWRIPLGGDKIAPLAFDASEGDIPLGDTPSGGNLSPESTSVPEPSNNGADAQKAELLAGMPLEWKFAHDEEIIEADLEKQRMEQLENDARDAAALICQNLADGEPLAMAFMLTRGIVLSYDKSSQTGHRKALRQMLDAKPRQVKPEHVQQAVLDLKSKKMTVKDLWSVAGTAIDLANPMPEQTTPEPADRLETL